MSRKQTIIRGTFILTATGFLCRFMGFFYRIFLSHTFGEEGVGLYQLIFPVYSLCFALTAAGLETAISRTVAQKVSLGRKKKPGRSFCSASSCPSFFPVSVSCFCREMQLTYPKSCWEIPAANRCSFHYPTPCRLQPSTVVYADTAMA